MRGLLEVVNEPLGIWIIPETVCAPPRIQCLSAVADLLFTGHFFFSGSFCIFLD